MCSVLGVGVKLSHIRLHPPIEGLETGQKHKPLWTQVWEGVFRSRHHRLFAHSLPDGFYAQRDYSTPSMYPHYRDKLPQTFTFLSRKNDKFDLIASTPMLFTEDTWLATRVLAFSWNHLVVNGEIVANENTFNYDDGYLSLILPPGEYSIGFNFKPNKIWRILNIVGKIAFCFTFFLFPFWNCYYLKC